VTSRSTAYLKALNDLGWLPLRAPYERLSARVWNADLCAMVSGKFGFEAAIYEVFGSEVIRDNE